MKLILCKLENESKEELEETDKDDNSSKTGLEDFCSFTFSTLNEELILGRNNLDSNDKQLSRNQAKLKLISKTQIEIQSLGKNPSIIYKKGKSARDGRFLQNNETEILEVGEKFSLLPSNKYLFQILDDNQSEIQLENISTNPHKSSKKRKQMDQADGAETDEFSEIPKSKHFKKEYNYSSSSENEVVKITDPNNLPLCKYGANCYRKNPEHLAKFRHEGPGSSSTSNIKEITPPIEVENITQKKFSIHSMKWKQVDSLYILDSDQITHSEKIAAFDMDGTLIIPKGTKKFPVDRHDWKWLYDSVPTTLKKYHSQGYKIVIFSNQAGIEKGKQKPEDIKGKLIDITKQLNFPLQAFIASSKDFYRKPNSTMWEYFLQHHNGKVRPELECCFFIGDQSGVGGSLSCDDRAFAYNIGVDFRTPEEIFLGELPKNYHWTSFDPSKFLADLPSTKYTGSAPLISKSQEIIVMVGFPASGKSSFCKKVLIPAGYVRVNRDELKSKEKCIKACQMSVEEGKSVVIDNTSPSREDRSIYIKIAKEHGIPCRCFVMQTTYEMAQHLNIFREKLTQGECKRIPDIAYNTYRSKFKEPSEKEGFKEIKTIYFLPDFPDERCKNLFLQRNG